MTDMQVPHEPIRSEDDFIREYLAPLSRGFAGSQMLADDCAILPPEPGADFVLKTDPVAEGVHFLPGTAPADVAWKALAVNVSDLAAKGAEPRAYLMALSFPVVPARGWMAAFVSGLADAQSAFGCHLIGGDTDVRPGPLSISITIIGAVPTGRLVARTGARPDDGVFVSGTIGDAGLGLESCRGGGTGWPIDAAARTDLEHRYLRPQPRLALRQALRDHATAAMDVSDGLVKDFGRLCRASGCAGRLFADQVPLSSPARAIVAADPPRLARLMAAGDDYEVLCTVPADRETAFLDAAARASVAMTRIGAIFAGTPAVAVLDRDGRRIEIKGGGWDHFGPPR